MTLTAIEARANVGRRICHTHPDGFRSNLGPDSWGTVVAVFDDFTKSRLLYVVRFDDGVTDLWVVNDPSDPYVFADYLWDTRDQ